MRGLLGFGNPLFSANNRASLYHTTKTPNTSFHDGFFFTNNLACIYYLLVGGFHNFFTSAFAFFNFSFALSNSIAAFTHTSLILIIFCFAFCHSCWSFFTSISTSASGFVHTICLCISLHLLIYV